MHDQAVTDALTYLESRALFTRQGTDGVRRLPVRGMIAARFVHRDSRAGDPDLHTHVAISNKVQTLAGDWLAIDATNPVRGQGDHLRGHYQPDRRPARPRPGHGTNASAIPGRTQTSCSAARRRGEPSSRSWSRSNRRRRADRHAALPEEPHPRISSLRQVSSELADPWRTCRAKR
ncbi:MAG TPA: relaxase domain-containing protein [Micropruina sp.]|nr:relaxase domain-containing protein [Micropruina sp.]